MCTYNFPIEVHFPHPGARASTIYQGLLARGTSSGEETSSVFSVSFLASNSPKFFSNPQKGKKKKSMFTDLKKKSKTMALQSRMAIITTPTMSSLYSYQQYAGKNSSLERSKQGSSFDLPLTISVTGSKPLHISTRFTIHKIGQGLTISVKVPLKSTKGALANHFRHP